MPTRRPRTTILPFLACLAALVMVPWAIAQVPGQNAKLIETLNDPWQRIQDGSKSWKPLLTAALDITEPPVEVGTDFDFTSIWPGMDGWQAWSAWAEKNAGVGKALLEAQDKIAFAMPYGEDQVDAQFRAKQYTITVSIEGEEKIVRFGYLRAIALINAYATAEMYRLAEAEKFEEAFQLGVAHLRVLRQLCDQSMREEMLFFMDAAAKAFSVHRDILWTYLDKLPAALVQRFGTKEYPFLRPADGGKLKRLEMPEGDRHVAQAILNQCFDDNGQPNADLFAEVFAGLQAANAPLTRFGAARRWKRIAEVHGSLDASTQKLTDVYDDWWRRWRMRPYDAILSVPTELSRLNKVRYAAVALSVLDLDEVFVARRRLAAEYAATVTAFGLAGYRRTFGNWPNDIEKAYTAFSPKRFDADPYDKDGGTFIYRFLDSEKKPVDTVWGRVFVEGCVLYARNDDHGDDGYTTHDPSGKAGDYICFPPIRVLARQQLGLK